MPPVHVKLVQSFPVEQVLPFAQRGQVPPPQSVSDSAPFFRLSVHPGAAQRPAEQMPLWQSAFRMQTLPFAQLVQLPPQSVSVSVPFFVVSVHEGAKHTPAAQYPLWQSELTLHDWAFAHVLPGAQAPPQSKSVSFPFLTPSAQVGDWHTPWGLQTPELQSPPKPHFLPAWHTGQVPPPQSMSVSTPFFVLSVHVGS